MAEKNPENIEIARRLEIARKAAGYRTATEFSAKNNIPQSTYANHEVGGRGVKKAAAKYADILNVRVAWLMYGEGTMQEEASSEILQIIEDFKSIPEPDKSSIRHLIRSLADKSRQQKIS